MKSGAMTLHFQPSRSATSFGQALLAEGMSGSCANDQCRHAAPCEDDTPAPNETGSTVAHKTSECKQFCQNISFGSVSRGFVSSGRSSHSHPTFPTAPQSQYGPAFIAVRATSHSGRVGAVSSRPLMQRATSVRPGGGCSPLGRAANHKDQCRRAPFSRESAPAPNETKGSVADEIDQANSSPRRTDDARA